MTERPGLVDSLILVPLDRESGVLARLRRTEGSSLHETVRHGDRGPVESSLTERPVRDATGTVGAAKIARDIGERKQAVLSGRRFLVVEDEPLIALDLAATLERAGADPVRSVGTEREALQMIEDSAFEGALLDANLHGRPVGAIAAALTRRKIPFVFVTGYGPDGLPHAFRHVKALAKPFSPQQLLEAVMGLMPSD